MPDRRGLDSFDAPPARGDGDLAGLLGVEPLPEVECPSCGTTIRARMADAPDVTSWQLEWPTPATVLAAYGGPAVTVHPLRNTHSDEDALEALQAVDASGLRGVRVIRLDTVRTPLGEDGPDTSCVHHDRRCSAVSGLCALDCPPAPR